MLRFECQKSNTDVCLCELEIFMSSTNQSSTTIRLGLYQIEVGGGITFYLDEFYIGELRTATLF